MTSKLQLAEESSAEPFVIFGGTESRRTVNTMKSLYDIVVLALMLPINLFWTLNVNVIRYARKTISILSSFFSPLFMFLNWLGFFLFFFFWGVILNTRHTQYSVCKIKKKKRQKKKKILKIYEHLFWSVIYPSLREGRAGKIRISFFAQWNWNRCYMECIIFLRSQEVGGKWTYNHKTVIFITMDGFQRQS